MKMKTKSRIVVRNKPKWWKFITIPENCSFVENPNWILGILALLDKKVEKWYSVNLDFSNITNLSNDALFVFISYIVKDKRLKEHVRLNLPSNEKLRRVFEESWILKYAYVDWKSAFRPSEWKIINNTSNNSVLPRMAKRICDIAAEKGVVVFMWREFKALYALLIEAMSNTFTHSWAKQGWWLFWSIDPDNKLLRIGFVDYGSWIFNEKLIDELSPLLGWLWLITNAEIIKWIMHWKYAIPSSIWHKHRGNWFKTMKSFSNLPIVRKYTIISNDAIGMISDRDNSYKTIGENEFPWTFLYWELG